MTSREAFCRLKIIAGLGMSALIVLTGCSPVDAAPQLPPAPIETSVPTRIPPTMVPITPQNRTVRDGLDEVCVKEHPEVAHGQVILAPGTRINVDDKSYIYYDPEKKEKQIEMRPVFIATGVEGAYIIPQSDGDLILMILSTINGGNSTTITVADFYKDCPPPSTPSPSTKLNSIMKAQVATIYTNSY